ncbi:MAG: ABC transporter permease [Prevotellaceae bacterium]|jgi:ABC-type antimicrobial peptide transport system permease subunit|nr:ABC transporter permease [Prevotellaceae bacterium]
MKQILYSWRLFTRFRTYTLINLVGLIFSVACAMIIARYVHQERTVDHYVPELDRTFLSTYVIGDDPPMIYGTQDDNSAHVNVFDDPCVELVARFRILSDDDVVSDNHRFKARIIIGDSLFLQMLPHPLLAGTDRIVAPQDAVITRDMAVRMFGGNDPIGKKLTIPTGDVVTVVGVVDKAATKSSLLFDVVVSNALQTRWSTRALNLVRLRRAEDVTALNLKNRKPLEEKDWDGRTSYFQLTPLKEFYMNAAFAYEYYKGVIQHGNARSLTILTIVAALLLVVGLFNYINLNTVMMLRRKREFDIKKVFGAKGRQLFVQLYAENLSLTAVAMLFVWSFVELTRGIVRQWFDITVAGNARFDLLASLSLLLLLPLVVSLFPYFRGRTKVSRTLFLFLQYLISVSLVITAIYFARQLHYVLNYDLGYRTKDIIQCTLFNYSVTYGSTREEMMALQQAYTDKSRIAEQRLNASPLFTEWSSTGLPLHPEQLEVNATASNGRETTLHHFHGDRHYMDMLGFQLKEGRLWDDEKDSFGSLNMIVNETALKALHINDIDSVTLTMDESLFLMVRDGEIVEGKGPYRIVGVVKDFKVGSLSQAVVPVGFYYGGRGSSYIVAAIAPGKRREAIAFLDSLYHELNGSGDFTYTFAEDDVAALYQDDRRASRIYIAFAGIAVCISCLGLFGLSLYDIRQRYREVALRKINGATSRDIFTLLLRKYLYVFAAAFVVASAVSTVVIVRYMQTFYHHAPLSWWIFVAAAALTALVSLGTLGWQISRAMRINPADVMKRE